MDPAPYINDTIVAAATPPGRGGVGIVRLSGPDCRRIAEALIGILPAPREATLATFRDADGEDIDSGLALFFPSPRSFTGEDVLELHGHGGPVVMSLLIDVAVAHGARRAEAGEFSKRAFLNGKIDLAQAEAIADLIDSGTGAAARAAHRSLQGAFSEAVEALSEQLVALRLHVEAAIDFPEEEIDFLDDEDLRVRVASTIAVFDALQKQAALGAALRDGLQVVIVGKPNAGKSSLMNALSGQDTAIVTEVAGTTRDILREQIEIDGLAVELVDTAGLRENPDVIEAEGIRRAREALKHADAVLWLQDASAEPNTSPNATPDASSDEPLPVGVPIIIVRNKIDLTDESPGLQDTDKPVVHLSAKTGTGLDALRQILREVAGHSEPGAGTFTARRRHLDALSRARTHFDAGVAALNESRAGELFAEELRLAHAALGEISGQMTADELLGQIFATFCIGK